MRPGGVEALRAALRRSLWLVALLIAVGVATVNTMRQLQGPEYVASSRVLLAATDIVATLQGTAQSYVDPKRLDDYELSIATSPQFFDRVAERTGGTLGIGPNIKSVTAVEGDSTSLSFSVRTDDALRSIRTANSVARAYRAWRADISGATIDEAITLAQRQITTGGSTPDLVALLNKLKLQKTLNSGDVILVEPTSSALKTRPAPVRDSLLGASIGLVIALLLVGAREAFDTTIRSEADVEELLDVPVFATIGTLPRRARLVMFGRHEERFGDAYALLAANLVQLGKGASRTIIAVTSATAGEGKTTTASNLAVAFARRGADVLLADFDLRKPSIEGIFRIPHESTGVAQILAGDAALEEAFWRVSLNGTRPAVHTVVPAAVGADAEYAASSESGERGSLRVLPAGDSIPTGTDIHSRKLPELLDELGQEADVVILDTPPALLTAEMAELARNVDMVLIVVRQGKVTRRTLRALQRQAQTWPPKIVGAVLTDAPPEENYSYYRGG